MKKEKITTLLKLFGATALAIGIAVSSVNVTEVQAGSSDIVIDSSSFEKGINTSVWTASGEEVTAQDGKIVFLGDAVGSTTLITKTSMQESDYQDEIFHLNCKLQIKDLPQNQKFAIGLSLGSAESYSGEAGNIEITFTNEGSLKTGIVAYDTDESVVTLLEPQSGLVSVGKSVDVAITAKKDMTLTVRLNNKTVYDQKSPVALEGRVGFLQTGGCKAEISSFNLKSYRYDRPENVNLTEDFETGSINTNTLTSRQVSGNYYYPSGVQVEEYNGSQVLMFRNSAVGYLGTIYRYSNFELTFDMPYMLYKGEMWDDATVKTPKSGALLVSFGDETDDYESAGYEQSADYIRFDGEKVSRKTETVSLADKVSIDKEKNEGYSIRISVIDTIVKVAVKELNADAYVEVMSYKIGNKTPNGYIHFWPSGSGTFAIDNVKIVNKDMDANVIDVEYKKGGIEGIGAEDWEYERAPMVFMEEEEAGFNYNLILPIAIGAAVLVAVIVGVVIILKKKNVKRKGEAANEI